jgi:glycosyltransferase involved in cell wall biosynthesis
VSAAPEFSVDTTREPSISVVIPAFQSERYIAQAIRSVTTQVPRPVEIIVVDDGSTDRTADVASAFPGVQLVRQANGGEAAARNTGLMMASSEWVAFLDADDRYLPGRLQAMAAAIASDPTLDVVTADGYLEIEGEIVGTCYGPQWTFEHHDQRNEILLRNFVLGHVVARRDRLLGLGGFDESISHTTDWQMWIRLVLDGGRIGFVDRHLSVYRLHARSLSADRLAMARGGLASLSAARDHHPSLSLEERRSLDESLALQRSLIAREELSAALVNGAGVRDAAWTVLADRRQPRPSRMKAGIAASAPKTASALQRSRRRHRAAGATGRWVPIAVTDDSEATAPDDPPLVSVVLPFLDEERFLRGAIETVFAQTVGSWELLLVDDGSSDASSAIADECAHDHPDRVCLLRHPGGGNLGLARSRNLGLDRARAGAVAFLDADDRWSPQKLERQLETLAEHPSAAMVCGPTWHSGIETDGEAVEHPVVVGAPALFRPGRFARELARETVIMPPPPSAVMYRTSALRSVGGVPEGDNLYEDQRTFVAVNLRYPVYIGDDEPVCIYTKRSDSLFGSLENEPAIKARQRRSFEWWMIGRCARAGPTGWRTGAALVGHRLVTAVRRRRRRVTSLWP